MEKSKKIKLYIGFFYLLFIWNIFILFFSKFSFQQLTSYDFIKNNINYFFKLKNNNLFLLSLFFLYFYNYYGYFPAGFGSPVAFLEVLYLGNGWEF